MAEYTALFDACVLYPFQLRDLLLYMSLTNLFQAKWTDQIHDEWIGSLVKNGGDAQKLARTRDLMNRAVPNSLVTGYEHWIDKLDLPDPDDRHVLAAAVAAKAHVIVTANLKDFPADKLSPFNLEAQHPDDFLVCQFDLNEAAVLSAVKEHRASLKKPPLDVSQYLDSLARVQLPQTVERLRQFASVI
jgi:hypothetical protein